LAIANLYLLCCYVLLYAYNITLVLCVIVELLDDMWMYNVANRSWQLISVQQAPGTVPLARAESAYWGFGDTFYIFGGAGNLPLPPCPAHDDSKYYYYDELI
jgi:hypothetical protein